MSESMQPKVCAITGTGGYLGGAVKQFFQQQGWRVLELTRHPAPGPSASRFQLGEDVAPATLAGVNALVHCAYDAKVRGWPNTHSTNVTGTEKLLRAAQAAGVERLIAISSISAFDGCLSLYGRAKLEIERLALAAGALVLRPGLIHGPEPRAMFGQLAAQARRAALLPLVGGSQKQHLVHIEDLCAIIHRHAVGMGAAPGHPLTVAHPKSWTVRELLEAMARSQGNRLRVISVPWRLVWGAAQNRGRLRLHSALSE